VYDAATKRWTDVGHPGDDVRAIAARIPGVPVPPPVDASAVLHGTEVAWKTGFSNPGGGLLLIREQGAAAASSFLAPWPQTVRLQVLDDQVLAVPVDQREFPRLTIGLLEPVRYARATHPNCSVGTAK
jgi:hypothetical protein